MQAQSSTMTQPPAVITTKDLLYISDMLSWNTTAIKTLQDYANRCTDPQISQALQQAYTMHQKHFDMLLDQMSSKQERFVQ
ncbi:DUF4142 domain-containing protein [Aureibacillus halotolerans]|uniref:Coat F domain-containing protein n=1 Tax=Aureibacillus halotolerans TaxID=1508390 RepID=A0A4R6U6H6_9BACI|nr:DUF4142 domain-containing protein [Aureibacillus halotolerans]TDQ40473.1 hypothetical protein EV213_106192 [Aureibacillus halotolerans]